MAQVKAGESGDFDRCAVCLGRFVRDGEEHHGLARSRLPESFDRGKFLRLVMQRVKSMQVAQQRLQRYEHRRKAQAHREHHLAFADESPAT